MNTPQRFVRKRPERTPQSGDPRPERSKRALGAALVELMLERRFDDITVQDVLDRAAISRATFYSHFRNKRDLFLSDYERMLERMEAHLDRDAARAPPRVAPVAEFFRHVAEAHALMQALRASGELNLVWELGVAHFASMIEKRLKLMSPARHALRASTALSARFCAGALIEMLKWWLEREARPSPEQMDALYHQMIWNAFG